MGRWLCRERLSGPLVFGLQSIVKPQQPIDTAIDFLINVPLCHWCLEHRHNVNVCMINSSISTEDFQRADSGRCWSALHNPFHTESRAPLSSTPCYKSHISRLSNAIIPAFDFGYVGFTFMHLADAFIWSKSLRTSKHFNKVQVNKSLKQTRDPTKYNPF